MLCAAATGGGLVALSLAGCAGSKKKAGTPQPKETLDPTTGVRGGTLIWQSFGDPGGGLDLLGSRNAGVHQLGGLILEGLLEFRNGTPAYAGTDILPQPNLAQAMPEQPDPQTYVFKLRPAKFHNGRQVTAEDVQYSFDRFALQSAWKNDLTWYDRTETPDPQTVVVKTKTVFAEVLLALTGYNNMEILAKEHQESPEAEKKMIGTGPYLVIEYNPPVLMRYKRNPDYHRQPYPYFDEIDRLGTSDPTKKVAEFISHQAHMSYWFPPEERDQIKKARPDAPIWRYTPSAPQLILRNDQPPFNDKRVRQALSMAIDRKQLNQAIYQGESEPDQWLTVGGEYWGFRRPSQLAAAKNFEFNVQAAKQLLSAAGVTLPLKIDMLPTWNATVLGQKHVDEITLITSQWRNNGIADARLVEMTFGQFSGAASVGNYTGAQWAVHPTGASPGMGLLLRNAFFSPPEGIKGPPTTNLSYTNIPELSALVEKQLQQLVKEERIQTLRQIEEILAEEMPRIPGLAHQQFWFGDPAVKNMQTAREAYNGATPYLKYWWFDGGKAP
jgi:peptide/nickel transport system substrate-binding protein